MKRLTPTLLGAAVLLLLAPAARAQNVIILDLDSPVELRETAGAVSMLLRSQLAPGHRKLAGDAELILALKLLGSPLHNGDGTVDQPIAERVMERLGADRMFVGTVARAGGRLSIRGQIVGVTGGRLGRVSVDGPVGDIGSMTGDLIRRLSVRLGLTPAIVLPNVSQGPMRALVDASAAVVQDDMPAAARHLALADRGVASKLRSAGPLAEAVITAEKTSLTERVNAALATGDHARALKLADEALAQAPENGAAHVARARALTAAGQLQEAEQELQQAGDEPTGLAGLELAMKPGSRRKAHDDEILKLLGDPDTVLPALAFISTTPPKAFSHRVEVAIVAAAENVQPKSAGLASAIGLRAVNGKVELSRAMRLILPQDLSSQQLQAVQKQIEGTPAATEPSAVKLQADMASREMALKELQRAQAYQGSNVSPELTASLGEMLKQLPPLAEGRARRVMIAPLHGSGTPLPIWPISVKPEPARDGLRVALITLQVKPPAEQAPSSAPAVVDGGAVDAGNAASAAVAAAAVPAAPADGGIGAATETAPADRGALEPLLLIDAPAGTMVDQSLATTSKLSDMADEGDADSILLYRVRARFAAVRVDLLLFDRDEGKTYEVSRWLTSAELRAWETAPLTGAAILLLLLFGGVIWRVSRMLGGNILVVLEQDPGAENEMFTIVIDQSQKGPKITSPADYKAEMNRTGETQSRFRATMAGLKTTFPHLKAGSYYVHLYGIYSRGDRIRVLDDFTAKVDVSSRQTASVVFKLAATLVEYSITVLDGEVVVPGATVWIDDDKGAGQVTPESGTVVMQVPKGMHTIHMEARGMSATKNLSVLNTKPQNIAFNLVWERKVEKASRALEGLVRPSQAMAAAQAVAAASRPTSDVKTPQRPQDKPDEESPAADIPSLPLGDGGPGLALSAPGEGASLPLMGNHGGGEGEPVGGAAEDMPSLPLMGQGESPAVPLGGPAEAAPGPGELPSLALGGPDDDEIALALGGLGEPEPQPAPAPAPARMAPLSMPGRGPAPQGGGLPPLGRPQPQPAARPSGLAPLSPAAPGQKPHAMAPLMPAGRHPAGPGAVPSRTPRPATVMGTRDGFPTPPAMGSGGHSPTSAHAIDDEAGMPSIPLATQEPAGSGPIVPVQHPRQASQFAHSSPAAPVEADALPSIPLAGPARTPAPVRPPSGGPPRKK